MVQKPRVIYAQFIAQQRQKPAVLTVAALIERYIREMNGLDTGRPVRVLGTSNVYTLRGLQRAPIGLIPAKELCKQDVTAHVKWRRETVSAATCMHDVTSLSTVLKYAGSAWDDCEDVSEAPVTTAKAFLSKNGYISPSTPRKRVPSEEEIQRLLEYLGRPPKKAHAHFITAMPDIMLFALASTRRISEICRITHGDIDWERKMYWVRDLKHPRFKIGNHKEFPMLDPIPEIIKRQPRLRPDDPTERVFPFYDKSVGARYTRAKKALGIENLHFHDNRREAITRWLKYLPPHKVKLISGHETTYILERVYDAQKSETLHGEIAALASQLPADVKPANHEPNWKSDHN